MYTPSWKPSGDPERYKRIKKARKIAFQNALSRMEKEEASKIMSAITTLRSSPHISERSAVEAIAALSIYIYVYGR